MPTSLPITLPAGFKVQSASVEALADTLWHLSLKLPAEPIRQHRQAVTLVARQMDEAIRGTLCATPMQAKDLMQELTGTAVSEAQMQDTAQLEQAHPDIRLAIGKVGLLYLETQPSAMAQGAPQDRYTPAVSNAAHDLGPIAGARPETPRPRSPATTPVDARVLRTPPVVPTAVPRLPAGLQRCLTDLAALKLSDKASEVDYLICPETGTLWSKPMLDMRDGRSYEQQFVPAGGPPEAWVENSEVAEIVQAWTEHSAKDACELAAHLDAACPRDAQEVLIVDPVRVAGGQIFSAAALVAAFQAGRVPEGLESRWYERFLCVDALIVKLMQHYDIGVPQRMDALDPASLDEFRSYTDLLRLGSKCHTDAGLSVSERTELWQDRDRIAQLQHLAPTLTRFQTAFGHILVDCNDAEYDRAFHGGLRLNSFIVDSTRVIETLRCIDTQARLLLMRATCYRLKGQLAAAEADLRGLYANRLILRTHVLVDVAANLALVIALQKQIDPQFNIILGQSWTLGHHGQEDAAAQLFEASKPLHKKQTARVQGMRGEKIILKELRQYLLEYPR